jgi:CMP-N-acetylneuraminic acid synthetase
VADDVRGYEMPPERSFDIDTQQDLAFAEFLVARGERA